MTKNCIALLLLLFSLNLSAQYIVKGHVRNEKSEGVPGVKIYVDSTTYGVITDYSGSYFLEVHQQKTYALRFNMLGMQDTVVQVIVNKKQTDLDIVLKEKTTELESVEIRTKKINVGQSIIKKVQKNRKNMAEQYDNYACTTYQKTGLEKEKHIFFRNDTTDQKPEKTNLIESISQTTFIAPNTYHEHIIAQHDYSDKESSTTTSSIDYFMDDIITPVQSIEVDPYLFFEKTQDGDFNLYQNMINLPKISEHPITSPIGVQAFTNYTFKLINILFEEGQKIYEIEVTPRFKTAPLFSGSIFILDELWVIKSFNLSVNPAAMPFFKEFNVIQDYEEVNGFWVPVRREFDYMIREEAYDISANTRVHHSNYQFNQAIQSKDFKNELSNYSTDAFIKDSAYWNANRPLQLKEEELDFIAEQVRIDSIKQSEHYLDSVDAVFNKITLGDIFLNGVGLRNRFKKHEFFIKPILGSAEFFGVGGFRYNFGGHYAKKFENAHQLKISPELNYGFLNYDLKPQLAVEYTFLPLKFGKVEVEIGDTYELLTNQLSIINWALGGNSSVRNRFVGLAYRQELVNGLYGRVKFSYANKQPLGGLQLGPIMDYFSKIDTTQFDFVNEPIDFEPYLISLFELKLQYRFKQQYIIKNNEKLIIGTEYPEIELTFRQGIPRLFGSEVQFNSIEAKVSDEINMGNYGDSNWKIIGGTFLNKKDLRIIEYKYFRPSDSFFLSNPLNTHQTLDTAISTNQLYAQGFYVHHFNGFFLNKIPLINRLGFESICGVSILMIPEAQFIYNDFFVGVEKKFKIRNQYLKYGFYYTGRFDTISSPYFRFKIGFDYLNTFTNKWSY